MQVSMRKVDMGLGVLCVAVGAIMLVQSLKLDFTIEDTPGPGFFPSLLAVALALVGGALAVTSLLSTQPDDVLDLPARSRLQRSAGLWVFLLASVLLITVVGFMIAMLALVASLIFGLEGKRNLAGVATIILIPLIAYLLFGVLLQVRFPTGVFGF
jgi:putative tricarboxylic transport membrane protein